MKTTNALMLFPILFGFTVTLSGQALLPPKFEIPLYDGVAPGSEDWDWNEILTSTKSGMPMAQNIVRPVLQYYPADPNRAVGTAMIVAPGGGFQNLMMSYEGVDIALRLNEMGVDAFILKYRLKYTGNQTKQIGQNIRDFAAADGQQAVRVIRAHASEFGIAPDRIGIMGFSAGGYVTLAAVMGPADARPNFAAPVYAPTGTERGMPILVPVNAPPLFIATAADDQIIPPECSMNLFSAWRNAGFSAELHIFQTGKHGFVIKGGGADNFMDRLEEWMKVNGWLE